MEPFKNILVATDTRLDQHPIVSEAVVLAQQMRASLTIVDTVPTFPWIVRLTLTNHEEIHELLTREKQTQLESLATPIRKQGIPVETKVLCGQTSTEIIRQVVRGKHDLVLRVAKGKDSRRDGFFDTTGHRLLRDCPCAVWLVAPAMSHHYKHVMACIDTGSDEALDDELNHKIFRSAELISQTHGSKRSIVHVWKVFGEEFLVGQMRGENFNQLVKNVRERFKNLLDTFLQKQENRVDAKNVHLLKGNATEVIPVFANDNSVDLVVMGTVARSGAAGLIIGNTAEQILNRIQCSVLALKPASFDCPIK